MSKPCIRLPAVYWAPPPLVPPFRARLPILSLARLISIDLGTEVEVPEFERRSSFGPRLEGRFSRVAPSMFCSLV